MNKFDEIIQENKRKTREKRFNYLQLQRKQIKKKNRVQTILTFTLIIYIMFSTILNIVLLSN